MKGESNSLCVLDASVTLSWLLPDEVMRSTILEQTSPQERLIIPPHWSAEIINSLEMGVRRNRISRQQQATLLSLLATLPLHVIEIPASEWKEWLSCMTSQQLTAYDAAYLYLAKQHHLPLATLDKSLKRAAVASDVELIPA